MLDLTQLMIISGGQTGVERAALDFALAHGIAHRGWCSRWRLADDEPIPQLSGQIDRVQRMITAVRRLSPMAR